MRRTFRRDELYGKYSASHVHLFPIHEKTLDFSAKGSKCIDERTETHPLLSYSYIEKEIEIEIEKELERETNRDTDINIDLNLDFDIRYNHRYRNKI